MNFRFCEKCDKEYPNTEKYFDILWCGNLSRICKKCKEEEQKNDKRK